VAHPTVSELRPHYADWVREAFQATTGLRLELSGQLGLDLG
jgi:hypothetical protein